MSVTCNTLGDRIKKFVIFKTARRREKGKVKALSFPFLNLNLSGCPVMPWRSRWHSWRHSPICKYRIKYWHHTKRIALFNCMTFLANKTKIKLILSPKESMLKIPKYFFLFGRMCSCYKILFWWNCTFVCTCVDFYQVFQGKNKEL